MKYVQYSMFYALQRALFVFLCNAFSEENEIIQFDSESKYLANNMVYMPKIGHTGFPNLHKMKGVDFYEIKMEARVPDSTPRF